MQNAQQITDILEVLVFLLPSIAYSMIEIYKQNIVRHKKNKSERFNLI